MTKTQITPLEYNLASFFECLIIAVFACLWHSDNRVENKIEIYWNLNTEQYVLA